MAIYARDSLTGTELVFPITPQSVQFDQEINYCEYNLLNGTQMRIPTGEKLQKLAFEGMLPGSTRTGTLISGDTPATDAQALMSQWLANGRKLLLSVESTLICNLPMYLASAKFTYKGGFGDIHYQLEFIQAAYSSSDALAMLDAESNAQWQCYTVRTGDTPWLISMRFYGLGNLFSLIRAANADLPIQLTPGIELNIPPRNWSVG